MKIDLETESPNQNPLYEEDEVREPDLRGFDKKTALAEEAENIRRQEGLRRRYWLIFNNEADRDRAYHLLMHHEDDLLFGNRLLGYNNDENNACGIEIDYKAVPHDMEGDLREFFQKNGLTVSRVYPEKRQDNVVPIKVEEDFPKSKIA